MVTVILDVPVVFSDDDRGGAWQIEERYEALGLEVMNKAEYKAACDWVHEAEDREADQADEVVLMRNYANYASSEGVNRGK